MKKNLSYGLGIGLLFLFITCIQTSYAEDETSETDIRSMASGNHRSLSQELLNPATIAFREKGEMGLIVLNRFDMKELNTYGAYAIFPNKCLDAGFKFSTYGYEEYRLIRGEISLAKKVTPEIAIGVQFGCLYEDSFLKEKSETGLIADPGIYWKINHKFEFAFITENLINTSNFLKPTFYSGIVYKPITYFQIYLESGYSRKQLHLSLGILYEILSQLTIRCGFRSDSFNPAIGASWKWKRWRLDVAFLLHNSLDLSSGIGLSYSF